MSLKLHLTLSQGDRTVAIGQNAGREHQGSEGIAVGRESGRTRQGSSAVAIGLQAGQLSQGATAIAIGSGAGVNNQHTRSIVLNATGSTLDTQQTDAFYVKPVREAAAVDQLFYDSTTGEITYSDAGSYISTSGTGVLAIGLPNARSVLKTNPSHITVKQDSGQVTAGELSVSSLYVSTLTGWVPKLYKGSWSVNFLGFTGGVVREVTAFFDDDSMMAPNNPTTGGIVTIPVTGKYTISHSIYTVNFDTINESAARVAFILNGSEITACNRQIPPNKVGEFDLCQSRAFTAGDEIELSLIGINGTPYPSVIENDPSNNSSTAFFSIIQIE